MDNHKHDHSWYSKIHVYYWLPLISCVSSWLMLGSQWPLQWILLGHQGPKQQLCKYWSWLILSMEWGYPFHHLTVNIPNLETKIWFPLLWAIWFPLATCPLRLLKLLEGRCRWQWVLPRIRETVEDSARMKPPRDIPIKIKQCWNHKHTTSLLV